MSGFRLANGRYLYMFYPYRYEENKEENKTFVVLCDECTGGEYSGSSLMDAERIVEECQRKGHQAFIYDE